jgi:hypothetical protein
VTLAVSRQSLATSAFITSPSPSPPAVSGVISSIELEVHLEVIHRFFHRFHPIRYFLHPPQYRRLPYKSSKGGIAFPIHRLRSKSSPQILSIESPSHSRAIHRLIIIAVAPLQVLKRGIVSPIHVSSLVLHPRRHPLHRVFSSHFSSHPSVNPQCRRLPYKSSKGE